MASPRYRHRALSVQLFALLFALFLTCQISLAQNGADPNLWQRGSAGSDPLTCAPCHFWFGAVPVGRTATQSAKFTNTGSTAITLSRLYPQAPGFSLNNLSLPMKLGAGQSVQFSISFTPRAASHTDGNFEVINSTVYGPFFLDVHGTGVTGGILGANPSSVSFGSVSPGKSETLPETLTNSGSSSLTVSQVRPAGAAFKVSGLSLPLTLAPGQSFTFGAVFSPTTGGRTTGSISVISTASNSSLTISLSGAGAASGQLAESPSSTNFNNVTVGTSKSLPIMLSATGSSVTISSATTNNSEFTLGGVTFPLTLAAGKSASFSLNFKPQSSGTASGSISFVSNASNSPIAEAVTGSGISTTGHSVNLSWNASSSKVVGYNVYRGSVSGGPYVQINPTVDPSTTYTDTTVVAGNTYYYVSTSLNSSGRESGFSNQVKAVVPSP
jgi:Abnormal spindle-like microcephaly-assoc'd, ASPM-SPD-2-Hydin